MNKWLFFLLLPGTALYSADTGISYKAMMQSLLENTNELQHAIYQKNIENINLAASKIAHHPLAALPQKLTKEDTETHDQELHYIADSIVKIAENGEWIKTRRAFNELIRSCQCCHVKWLQLMEHNCTSLPLQPFKTPPIKEESTKNSSIFTPSLEMYLHQPKRDMP